MSEHQYWNSGISDKNEKEKKIKNYKRNLLIMCLITFMAMFGGVLAGGAITQTAFADANGFTEASAAEKNAFKGLPVFSMLSTFLPNNAFQTNGYELVSAKSTGKFIFYLLSNFSALS